MPGQSDIEPQAISLRMKAMLDEMVAQCATRPGPETLGNIIAGAGRCTSDCASQSGGPCDCGAEEFRAKFGSGKHTP